MKIIESQFGVVRHKRRKIKLDWLEKEFVQTVYTDRSAYELDGGFTILAFAIEELLTDNYLIPVHASQKSYKPPFIHTAYWLTESTPSSGGWDSSAMLRMQDLLDLRYYDNHPEEQVEKVWTRIEQVYTFLLTVKDREVITREERSLELFGREKWLSEPEGEGFLRRIGLTLTDLRAVVAREPFVHYVQPAKTIAITLIVENKSFFHSAKQLMRQGKTVCGLSPDMLIYGEGWKIDSSLLFLEELDIDPLRIILFYVGDMDRAGWDIYGKLKHSYPDLDLRLAIPIYEQMMEHTGSTYTYDTEQSCNPNHLTTVLQEFSEYPELREFIDQLLDENRRVPQEILNYEVMARLT
ncbi:Wadjet anti-phage system protein JetD domain-containing protein [Paenibacillus sp. IHBB 10380]|uniref:Wadjet anti-phage system protein JetD domain-containing protein n=1 Tax=Paenibacillus sp. IHBB 10380 TaxID=1566358 RepID=UPI0005CFD035|nr:Wadjet anti-phage system protein JetD domain-containing protein [Paenibacillus sp. IHBB 10380]AJS61176.1 hypothetical protein UB51_25155 [Paenibacillus sp. IHBB 10380]